MCTAYRRPKHARRIPTYNLKIKTRLCQPEGVRTHHNPSLLAILLRFTRCQTSRMGDRASLHTMACPHRRFHQQIRAIPDSIN
jgi:hypothetical protein